MEIVSRSRTNLRIKKIRKAIRRAKKSVESIFSESIEHIDDFAYKIDSTITAHKASLLPLSRESIRLSNLKNLSELNEVYYLALIAYKVYINEKGFGEVNYDNGRMRVSGALSVPILHRLCTDILLPKQFMWYFEALVTSTLGGFYVKEYLKYSKHFYTTLIRAFKNYQIPRKKIIEYLSMVHKHRPLILVDDLQVAFLEYGFKSKEFESFMEANLVFDLRNPPPYPLPEEVQDKFWLYLPSVWINYLNYGFPINTDEDVQFRNDFMNQILPCVYPARYRLMKVPTLVEIARDVYREYVHSKCPYKQPLAFYNAICRLNVPNDIKDILLLRNVK